MEAAGALARCLVLSRDFIDTAAAVTMFLAVSGGLLDPGPVQGRDAVESPLGECTCEQRLGAGGVDPVWGR